jgi:hypothetical protein
MWLFGLVSYHEISKIIGFNVGTYMSDYFVYGPGGGIAGNKKGDEIASLMTKRADLRGADFEDVFLAQLLKTTTVIFP